MKNYLKQNVYDAANARIDYIFKNFERVYLSFSGGKDSGVMLNLVIDYMRKNNITEKIGIMVMDNEANYTLSLDFMFRIIEKNLDLLDVYWCCLPITLPCTTSSFMTEWQCWGEADKDKWIRPIYDKPYITHFQNHNMPFFKENMHYDEFWDKFGEWYSQGKKTACLIGIRCDESLNRFRAIFNERKIMSDGLHWTKKNSDNVYNCYPIYDWTNKDVWVANGKLDWDYNKLYDIFWKAGMTVAQMRVASPFMSEAKSSLNMYRVIEPKIWRYVCARVHGANFIASYGKQLSYRSVDLPKGHTWKSFTKFLLESLPPEVKKNFEQRIIQSIKYWGRTGRGLDDKTIEQLRENNIKFTTNGLTRHGSQTLSRVVIKTPPDHLDCLKNHPSDVTSWKRFAITILKNDHTCKYLGLAPTKSQAERQKAIMEKYKKL